MMASLSVSAALAQAQSAPTEPAALQEARDAIGAAQYSQALSALERAVAEGVAQPEHLAEMYRLRGETLVAIGQVPEAREAFTLLLVLEPEASLGEFVSPKILAVLDEAREQLAGAKLTAHHQFATETRQLDVLVDSDPAQMAMKVRLTYPRADKSSARLTIALESGTAVFDVPSQASEGVVLALLDRWGNVILDWSVEAMPVAKPARIEPVAAIAGAGPTPLWARWWVWAGASAGFAVAGSVFAITVKSAQDDLDQVIGNPNEHFFREAKSLEDKARSRALMANLSMGLAAATGITAGVLYWRGRRLESSLQVQPAQRGTGATLLLEGRF